VTAVGLLTVDHILITQFSSSQEKSSLNLVVYCTGTLLFSPVQDLAQLVVDRAHSETLYFS